MYVIHYTTAPSAVSKDSTAALMKEFGARGEMAGTIAHYVYPGGGGMVITSENDLAVVYETVTAYAEWLDFDVRPILNVDDAVPIILKYLGA
jgi:hypothetical protein